MTPFRPPDTVEEHQRASSTAKVAVGCSAVLILLLLTVLGCLALVLIEVRTQHQRGQREKAAIDRLIEAHPRLFANVQTTQYPNGVVLLRGFVKSEGDLQRMKELLQTAVGSADMKFRLSGVKVSPADL